MQIATAVTETKIDTESRRAPTIGKGLEVSEIGRLQALARTRHVPAKTTLFYEMDPAGYVFEVLDGILKLYRLTADGRRQITGFIYPGQFLGLTHLGCYTCGAEAVTDVSVLCYPRERLEALIDDVPQLARRLLELANDELLSAQNQIVWLGRCNTLERVGSFLLQLTDRVEASGGDPQEIYLPMSRADIADYLGLTVETVSRTFTRLRKMGAISLRDGGRRVACDLDWLHDLSDDPTATVH